MNNKQPTQLQNYIQSETITADRITIINNTKTQLNHSIAYLLQDTTYQKDYLDYWQTFTKYKTNQHT